MPAERGRVFGGSLARPKTRPFCRPARYRAENLGEILRGDRITNTPYQLKMNQNVTCRLLCPDSATDSEAREYSKKEILQFVTKIKQEYRSHWIVDNLPSATKLVVEEKSTYLHGFPIGYVDADGVKLFNHVTIIIKVHQAVPGSHRIVGFEIKEGSFAADAYTVDPDKRTCTIKTDGHILPPPVLLREDMKDDETMKVKWSYGVRFEPSDIAWASRWDTYLEMSDVEIHWFSIINSFVTVLFLSAIFGVIIVRTLSNDIAKYNSIEEEEDEEPTGWKLVHGDVFRPPVHVEFFSGLVGSGVQLLGMGIVTLVFALLGMLSPASRGALMTVAIVVWLCMGLISGYYSSRMYKTMGGERWKQAAMLTACLFPAIVFGTGFIINFFLWNKKSSGALPFTTMLALFLMWFAGSAPLVLMGAFFGFRKEKYKFPIGVNIIARAIPPQAWFLHPVTSVMLSGILPFGAVFIELFFILNVSLCCACPLGWGFVRRACHAAGRAPRPRASIVWQPSVRLDRGVFLSPVPLRRPSGRTSSTTCSGSSSSSSAS